jgi:hypothetical protein
LYCIWFLLLSGCGGGQRDDARDATPGLRGAANFPGPG